VISVSQEKVESLYQVLDILQNPFVGTESSGNHSKYMARNGFFVELQTFLINSVLVPGVGDSSCQVKNSRENIHRGP